MVKEVTESRELVFEDTSVTVIVQLEYVPSERELKVIVLLPEDADVVVDVQEPPYEIVPASLEEKVYKGVVLEVGLLTGVTSERVGAIVSTVAVVVARVEKFPALSYANIE
jgi:hypothetical protein